MMIGRKTWCVPHYFPQYLDKARPKSRLDTLSAADMAAVEDAILLHLGMRR